MLNITVVNNLGEEIRYEYGSAGEFLEEMDRYSGDISVPAIPMLNYVLVDVDTDDADIEGWWSNAQSGSVYDLYEACTERECEM